MKKRLHLLLLTLSILTAFQNYGQVSICDGKHSSHSVDVDVLYLKDSLLLTGIDTVIVYRHWLEKNGYNRYGKVIWLDNGQCYQYRIDIENSLVKYGFKGVTLSKLDSDSLISFFFKNQIDTVKSNPTIQDIQMSHDGEHFVQVNYRNSSNCFIISDLLVQFNPDNLRAKFIGLLAEENIQRIIIDGARTTSTKKKRKRMN